MTISISSAPSPRAKAVSATFTSVKVCEVGKPPDTAAIFTEDTSRLARTVPAKLGYTQIAATLGISGCSSSKSFTRLVNLVIESVLSSVCNEVRSIQLNKNLYTSGVLFVAKLSHTIFSTADATCASSKSVLYRLNISSYLSIFC